MPFWKIQQMLQRGYWEEAGSGEGGGGAGGSASADEAAAIAATKAAALAEAEAEAAKQKGEENKLSDKEAELLKEVMKHKTKAKETEAALLELKQNYSKFEGIDLDEVKSLLEEKKNSEQKKLEDKGEWETLKKTMAEENAKLVKAESEKYTELLAKFESQQSKIDKLTLGNKFSTSNFILNDLTLSPEKTKIIYGSHFEFNGEDVIAYDKPKGVEGRAQLVDASGEPLSFEDSIKKIVENDPDKDRLIKTKQKQGSGSGTLGANGNVTNTKPASGVDLISKALNAKK